MFFSRVILFTISLGALSVLATPHALHHHALHRRAVAARVASAHTNESAVAAKRQNSPKCQQKPTSSIAVPSAIVAIPNTVPPPPTTPKPSSSKSSPTSTPQQQQPPTTTTPTQPSNPSTPGLTGGPYSGQGTFFATGLGACGDTNSDSDFIVAVSQSRFDTFPGYDGGNPNRNPICNKKVTITGPTGATQTATIVDRCTGCAYDDLDMTPTLFGHFSDLGAGRINIKWNFI